MNRKRIQTNQSYVRYVYGNTHQYAKHPQNGSVFATSSTVLSLGFKVHILEPDVPQALDEKALIALGQILRQPGLGQIRGSRPGVLELVRRLLVHVQKHMRDIPQVDDIPENAAGLLPPVVEDFSAARETVDPVLEHLANGRYGHVFPKESDASGPGETIEQILGRGLGLVSLIEAGFKLNGDRDNHTRQLPDIEWKGGIPVAPESAEFVSYGRSNHALRELTILGVGGESIEPGHGIVCGPDGAFSGQGNGKVRDMERRAASEVKDLHRIETV